MTVTRSKRLMLSAAAAIGVTLGSVGIANAVTNPTPTPTPTPTPSFSVAPSTPEAPSSESATEAPESKTEPAGEVNGVNCENGIDTATKAQCDGGPAANADDGAPETNSAEG